MKHTAYLRLTPIALVLWLSACTTVGTDFQTPSNPLETLTLSQNSSSPDLLATLKLSEQDLPERWWTVFNDPVLNQLQEQLLTDAPDLRTAALRFAQARAKQGITSAQSGIQANANAQAERVKISENGSETRMMSALGNDALTEVISEPYSLYQAGFDATWELDLWGRVRRLNETAAASSEIAAWVVKDVHLSLSAELAKAYFTLRQSQDSEQYTAQAIDLSQNQIKLLQSQYRNGLIAQDSVLTAQTQLRDLQAALAQNQAQTAQLKNQIALLLGKDVSSLQNLLGSANTQKATLPPLNVGIPSQIVRRRADIRAAEATLHAATAQIGVAVADLYPRITLSASAGLQSVGLGNLTDWGSHSWQVGPVLRLPIFNRAGLHATVELRELEQQEAAIAYQKTVLSAWQEVDNTLTAYAAEQQQQRQLIGRQGEQQQALKHAEARYKNGLSNYLPVLQAKQALLQTQSDLTVSTARLRTHLISLYKAVGGGV